MYTYTGDVNIENGGQYLDLEEFAKWKDFCPCVRITDLDSGCGFTGAVLIERGSVYIPEDETKRQAARDCCGYTKEETDKEPVLMVESMLAYGGMDNDSYNGEIIIQTDKEGVIEFDGWKADIDQTKAFHESGLTLREFIESEFVR